MSVEFQIDASLAHGQLPPPPQDLLLRAKHLFVAAKHDDSGSSKQN
jgi:hypothetical protein